MFRPEQGQPSWPKHFLYLSPAKIDSIYYQIDQATLRGLAKTLTLDLEIIKAEVSSAAPPDTTYSLLKVVLGFLERECLVGSIDYPGAYFSGSLAVRWGRTAVDTSLEWSIPELIPKERS